MYSVGDILIGNEQNNYSHTAKGTLVEVLSTEKRYINEYSYEVLTVRIVDGLYEGSVFSAVEAKYFSPVSKAREATVDLLSVYK